MSNNATTLLEQLRLRSVRDLLSIASMHRISYAEGLSPYDCRRLIQIYDGELDFDADFYRSWADGEKQWEQFRKEFCPNSSEGSDRRERPTFPELCNEIGNQLVIAEDNREKSAERIARILLDPKVMEAALHDVSDCSMELLRCAARNLKADRSASFWQEISVPDNDRYSAFLLENKGYVRLKRVPATQKRLTKVAAVEIVPEIAQLVSEIDTERFNSHRKYKYWLSSCAETAREYYMMPPSDVIYGLLQEIKAHEPEMYLPGFGEEFLDDLAAFVSDQSWIRMFEAGDRSYIIDEGLYDYEEEGDYSFVRDQIDLYDSRNYDFYMPDYDELIEYDINNYWPSREPWKRLYDFLLMVYEEEQILDNMFPSMFNAMSNLEPDDPNHMELSYTRDTVLDNTEEKLSLLKWLLMGGQGADSCMEECEDISFSMREEFKAELQEILEACEAVTPKANNMGYV